MLVLEGKLRTYKSYLNERGDSVNPDYTGWGREFKALINVSDCTPFYYDDAGCDSYLVTSQDVMYPSNIGYLSLRAVEDGTLFLRKPLLSDLIDLPTIEISLRGQDMKWIMVHVKEDARQDFIEYLENNTYSF